VERDARVKEREKERWKWAGKQNAGKKDRRMEG